MIFDKAGMYDIAALTGSRLGYLREDYGELPTDLSDKLAHDLPDYFRKHLNKDLFVFTCRDNGVIISCCFLYVSEKPPNPSFISGRTGTVMNVYTKKEFRRRGIAGKLLKMLLNEAEELGLDFVELKATDAGYELYKSVGFEDVRSRFHNMKYVIRSEAGKGVVSLLTEKEQAIVDKVIAERAKSRELESDPPHEQDNIPNPFAVLTLEESHYLQEHSYLLKEIELLW